MLRFPSLLRVCNLRAAASHFLFPQRIHRLATLLLLNAGLLGAHAALPPPIRTTVPCDTNWLFHFGDDAAVALSGGASDWTSIRLPHTWNASDGADGGGDYARGTGWYVRRLAPNPAFVGRRLLLQCDGANRNATVYLNGRQVGEHVGGYTRFRIDLTAAWRTDAENLLAIRVDNAEDGLPPVSADYTFFGGLYRSVQLLALDPIHFDVTEYGADGVFVIPAHVSEREAQFTVAVHLRNDSPQSGPITLRAMVRDPFGRIVGEQTQPCTVAAGADARVNLPFTLEQPQLWNARAAPLLYRVEVTLSTADRTCDRFAQRFGLRYFSVDPDHGFSLNGQPLDLHGVNRHQDRAGKGWAISPDDDREDFALIQEIGANAIRVAHYPQSQLWFDLADEHGLVAWAEIPVVNEVLDTAAYTATARQQLLELIWQNHHHPAICFWGVANETREAGESIHGQRANGPASDHLIGELAALAQATDPSRLSTYASHHRADDSRNFHTDVLGFNKYFGWYGGAATDFAAWADETHRRFPQLRFGLSEYGAGANPMQHDPAGPRPKPGGDWHPEEYQALVHEITWAAMRERPYLWGKFIWNMFDFASDGRAEGSTPGLNDKGLVTYDRLTRKDAFYWYQANWSTTPMLHVTGRRYLHPPAGPFELKVYSNALQVELFQNGQSCGVVTAPDHLFRWPVILVVGDNDFEARATTPSGPLTDRVRFVCPPSAQP